MASRQPNVIKIIIRHTPRFARRDLHRAVATERIFPNVASKHHFPSCAGDCNVAALATAKGLALVNVFADLALINAP